jgi:SAM-dependent methyltransferase
MSLYLRALGTAFVYNHVRPLVVGGIDMTPYYDRVKATASDVILDVGCGTGDALRYLKVFSSYHGFDTDEGAIRAARKAHSKRSSVSFQCQPCTSEDVALLQPTEVLLCGLLHHVPDEVALSLFSAFKASKRLKRIVTSDIVFLPGDTVSNLLARFDRGRFCRSRHEFEGLVTRAGLKLVESDVVRSHPTRGLAKYLMMTIEP